MKYTDDDLSRLTTCTKRIVDSPRKESIQERGSLRNGFTLESEDGTERFSAFMRQNRHFAENFSIGLVYAPRNGQKLTLLRLNGPHGPQRSLDNEQSAHFDYHIHRTQADDVNDGNLTERAGCLTVELTSYEEALVYFISAVGIIDAEMLLPSNSFQLPLLFEEGE